MLYTKDVIRIEEETEKDIEDFCDEDYFINKYGQDYVDKHFESSDDEDEEFEVEEENSEPEIKVNDKKFVYSFY